MMIGGMVNGQEFLLTNMFYKYIIDKSIGFVEILTEVIDCILN